jgi:hypothetical protein
MRMTSGIFQEAVAQPSTENPTHVNDDTFRRSATLAFPLGLIQIRHRHGRAFGGEPTRHFSADAAGAAGYDGSPVGEIHDRSPACVHFSARRPSMASLCRPIRVAHNRRQRNSFSA